MFGVPRPRTPPATSARLARPHTPRVRSWLLSAQQRIRKTRGPIPSESSAAQAPAARMSLPRVSLALGLSRRGVSPRLSIVPPWLCARRRCPPAVAASRRIYLPLYAAAAGLKSFSTTAISRTTSTLTSTSNTMDAAELANYLADSPPLAVRLEIKKHFDALSEQQKLYAHYISR